MKQGGSVVILKLQADEFENLADQEELMIEPSQGWGAELT